MSNCVFPKLPGLTFEIKPVPTWSTVIQKSKNRTRTAIMNDPYPLWTFELTFEFLRDSPPVNPGASNPNGYSELEQIVGFYNARGGSFDNFLLDPGMLTGNPAASTVTGAPVGTGDGDTTVFYLLRDCGGFLDEVQAPVSPVVISVNGAVQASGWTLGANGVITFAAAPASGAVITWSGSWQWPVCFAEDSLGIEQFMYQLYELQTLKFEQVKF
jgi:uncharacterized protein (TIGR02217 family)